MCVCEQEQELVCVCACVQQRKRESITIFSAIYSSLLWLVETLQPYSKKNMVYYNSWNTLKNPKLTPRVGEVSIVLPPSCEKVQE